MTATDTDPALALTRHAAAVLRAVRRQSVRREAKSKELRCHDLPPGRPLMSRCALRAHKPVRVPARGSSARCRSVRQARWHECARRPPRRRRTGNAFRAHSLLQQQHVVTHCTPSVCVPLVRSLTNARMSPLPTCTFQLTNVISSMPIATGAVGAAAVASRVRPRLAPRVESRALARIIWRKATEAPPIDRNRRTRGRSREVSNARRTG